MCFQALKKNLSQKLNLTKALGFVLFIVAASLTFEAGASAAGSYLFGDSLYGSEQPSALRIVIKDKSIASSLTQAYVDTLSNEKSTLMEIYHLSNRDYNKLAAIAFGILGRETKFGTSIKYVWKEAHQSEIWEYKLARKKLIDYKAALRARDPQKFFAFKTWQVAPNSRGLTQIKSIPVSINHFYCFNEDQLGDPHMTAIATLGFLAESLKVLKNRVRNKQLTYVTHENLFDYVLYVYFGSMRLLVQPVIDQQTGRLVNDVATPDRNMYIKTVRTYIRSLGMFENQHAVLEIHSDYACRTPVDNSR
jgi:hypothetical protein